MYKTISISNDTYQNLSSIASRVDKPKSQVIDELIKGYIETMKEQEKEQLQAYNKFVTKLAQKVKLPKGAKIKSEDLDKKLNVLKDRDF